MKAGTVHNGKVLGVNGQWYPAMRRPPRPATKLVAEERATPPKLEAPAPAPAPEPLAKPVPTSRVDSLLATWREI